MDAHQDKQMGCPKPWDSYMFLKFKSATLSKIYKIKSIRAETRPPWTSDFSELVNPKASIIC